MMSGLKRVYFEGKQLKINSSFHNFQTQTVLILTSALSKIFVFSVETLINQAVGFEQ